MNILSNKLEDSNNTGFIQFKVKKSKNITLELIDCCSLTKEWLKSDSLFDLINIIDSSFITEINIIEPSSYEMSSISFQIGSKYYEGIISSLEKNIFICTFYHQTDCKLRNKVLTNKLNQLLDRIQLDYLIKEISDIFIRDNNLIKNTHLAMSNILTYFEGDIISFYDINYLDEYVSQIAVINDIGEFDLIENGNTSNVRLFSRLLEELKSGNPLIINNENENLFNSENIEELKISKNGSKVFLPLFKNEELDSFICISSESTRYNFSNIYSDGLKLLSSSFISGYLKSLAQHNNYKNNKIQEFGWLCENRILINKSFFRSLEKILGYFIYLLKANTATYFELSSTMESISTFEPIKYIDINKLLKDYKNINVFIIDNISNYFSESVINELDTEFENNNYFAVRVKSGAETVGIFLVSFTLDLFSQSDIKSMLLSLSNMSNHYIEKEFRNKDLVNLSEKISSVLKLTNSRFWEYNLENNDFDNYEEIIDFFGYNKNDFNVGLNKLLEDIVHPDDFLLLKQSFSIYRDRISNNLYVEFRVLHKDLGYLWYSIEGCNVSTSKTDEISSVSGLLKLINDVKSLELDKKVQSEKTKKILDYTNIGIWSYDVDNDIVKVNDKFHGVISDKLYNEGVTYNYLKKWMSLDSHNEAKAFYQDLVSGECNNDEKELCFLQDDGKEFWVLVKGFPIRDESGIVRRIEGIYTDITKLKKISNDLKNRNKELKYIFDSIGFEMFTYDIEQDKVNLRLTSILNNHNDMTSNEFMENHIHDEDIIYSRDLLQKLLSQEIKDGSTQYRLTNDKKSCQYTWVEHIGIVTDYDKNGKPSKILSVIKNIDSEKKATLELIERERKMSYIFANTSNLIIEIDSKGIISFINDKSFKITTASNLLKYIHPMDKDIFMNLLSGNSNKVLQFRLFNSFGEYRRFEWSISKNDSSERDRNYILVGRDITIEYEQQAKIDYQRTHDKLTGVKNIVYLHEYLSNINDKPTTCIYLNIDKFKEVNDIFGHDVGDEILIKFAKRIQAIISEQDICCRITGDEFVIVTHYDLDEKEMKQTFNRYISELCSEKFYCHNSSFMLTVSAGFASFPIVTKNPRELIRFSELAMIEAKRNHKLAVVNFTSDMFKKKEYIKSIIEDARNSNITEEFGFYYQPIVNIDDPGLIQCEALIRWNHPERGLLTPYHFVDIIEKSGQLAIIGEIIFEESINQVKKWSIETGKKVVVSYNMSPTTLQIEGRAQMLVDIVNKYNLDPGQIHFEITENLALDVNDIVIENLNVFRSNGHKIALDDFGIQYSTLSKLGELNYDIIKVDKFFTQSCEDVVSQSILNMISEITLKCNKESVVEGVETKEQLELIASLGYKNIQGYYFSIPLKKEEFTKYILDRV